MRGLLSTVFDVLESSLQYEHGGVIKGRFEEDFDKTRDSTVVVLEWSRAFDGLQSVEVVLRYGGRRVVLRRWVPEVSGRVKPHGMALIPC